MSGNPNPVEVREALDLQHDVESAVLTLSGMEWLVSPIDRVFAAARAWLDLWEPCENCDGSGHDNSKFCPATAWEDLHPGDPSTRCHPCPACNGLGVIPNRAKLDVFEAHLIRWFNAHAHRGNQGVSLAEACEFGEAAIGAFLGLGER